LDVRPKYKVGKAENLKNRISSHNSSYADNVKILFTYEIEDIKRVENCLKSILKPYEYRDKKEIYEINIDILKEVIKGCEHLITKVEQMDKVQTGGNYLL